MLLTIANKCYELESKQHDISFAKCAQKAINLDLRIKLTNEDLVNISERHAI